MSANTIHSSLDQFTEDVENHQMQVLVDDDVHRSLLFKQPNTGNQYFRINTWPHHLCISGDMGTFVFSRLPDMFEFFRGDKEPNLGYWSEKLEAGTAEKYSEDKARAEILRQTKDADLEQDDLEHAINSIAEMDLSCEASLHVELNVWHPELDGFEIDATELYDCNEYTYHFVWCCRAIIWSIQQYDLAKVKQEAA